MAASVARMSEARSGLAIGERKFDPACRYAHAGYLL
jgi:hypothetical protein